MDSEKKKRNLDILKDVASGSSFGTVAKKFGLSHRGVSLLVRKEIELHTEGGWTSANGWCTSDNLYLDGQDAKVG